jgi:signal transduction histidine kinase
VLGYTELAKAYLEEVYDQVTRRGEALPWLAPERLKKVICYLAAVEESVQRIKTVMQRLLALGRPEPRGRSTIDLNRLVSESVEVVRGQFAGRQGTRVEMLVSLGEGLPSFTGKTKALQTALLALLLNAYDAIEDAGEIRVSTGRGEDEVFVAVEDDGCGIPEELMTRIFEPFFTTKDPTTMPGASGLGLTEAARIVAQHEGSIKAWSAPGRGSRFTVSIPLSHDRRRRRRPKGVPSLLTCPPAWAPGRPLPSRADRAPLPGRSRSRRRRNSAPRPRTCAPCRPLPSSPCRSGRR